MEYKRLVLPDWYGPWKIVGIWVVSAVSRMEEKPFLFSGGIWSTGSLGLMGPYGLICSIGRGLLRGPSGCPLPMTLLACYLCGMHGMKDSL